MQDDDGVLAKWGKFAKTTTIRRASIVTHPGTGIGVSNAIKGSVFPKMLSDMKDGGFIGVLYDHKLAGEASARAQLRLAAFRDDFCISFIRGRY